MAYLYGKLPIYSWFTHKKWWFTYEKHGDLPIKNGCVASSLCKRLPEGISNYGDLPSYKMVIMAYL